MVVVVVVVVVAVMVGVFHHRHTHTKKNQQSSRGSIRIEWNVLEDGKQTRNGRQKTKNKTNKMAGVGGGERNQRPK